MRKKSENTNNLENKIDNKEEVKLEDNKIEENKIKDNKKESKTVKATEQKENNQEKAITPKASSKKANSSKVNIDTGKEDTAKDSNKISSEKKTKNSEKNATVQEKTNKGKSASKEKKIMQSTIAEISTEAKENLSEVESKSLLKKEGSEIDAEKLKTIREVSKDKVKNSALRKKLQRNLLIAILVTIYFLFIDLGINSIPITVYIQDLKTFTIFIVLIAIVIFEKAYKKDENYLALHGIEMVVIGIETLLILQLYSTGNEYFKYVLLGITLGMLAYYIIKCLIIYIRYKVTRK